MMGLQDFHHAVEAANKWKTNEKDPARSAAINTQREGESNCAPAVNKAEEMLLPLSLEWPPSPPF